MANLQDSHMWNGWDDHQKNGVENIFDKRYTDFKDGSYTHDIKAKCKDGEAKFRTQVNATEGTQLCSMKGATLAGAWDWKGLLNGALVKLKVSGKGVDCHVDAGRKSFFNDKYHANFWWAFNAPNKSHAMNVWQWSWRTGCIGTWAMQGWKATECYEMAYAPNEQKTGPGKLDLVDKICMSKDQHELHFNWKVSTKPGGSMAPECTMAYQFKESDKMTYLKSCWNMASSAMPFVHWGGSYKFNNYANVAYRVNYKHAEKAAVHSFGAEGNCYDAQVYYKVHVDFGHKLDTEVKEGEEKAPTTASFNLFSEHKCCKNFAYKYKVNVNLHDPKDYKWGMVVTSNV